MNRDELIDKLQQENINLKRIIAKELNENDELGSEFVYVIILKDKLNKAIEALKVAHQVIMITHPQLSDIEMNTLTIRQHDVWRHYENILAEISETK